MERNEACTVGRLEFLVWPSTANIQELEACINRLEREKDILKKATALLMADEFVVV